MRSAHALVALAAACGGSGGDPAQCRRQAAELATLLSTMDHEPGFFRAGDARLASRSDVDRDPAAMAPMVTVLPTALQIQGERVESSELDERLIAARRAMEEDAERYGRRGPAVDPTLIYLIVDEAALWGRVGEVASAAHRAGFTRPAFVFARPPAPIEKPPRSPIDADLDRLMASEEAGNKATELARMTEEVVKTCPALVRAFGDVASESSESAADILIRAIEPSLVECNCRLDVAALRSIMFRLLYVPHPAGTVRVTLDPARPPLPIAPDTTWRVASAQLAGGAAVWFAPLP